MATKALTQNFFKITSKENKAKVAKKTASMRWSDLEILYNSEPRNAPITKAVEFSTDMLPMYSSFCKNKMFNEPMSVKKLLQQIDQKKSRLASMNESIHASTRDK